MSTQPDPAEKFNLKNLHSDGRLKTGDTVPTDRGVGWEGAVHGLTRANRPEEYKNLSRQDVAAGAAVIEEKLKSKDNYGGGLDRKDVKDLDHKFETMRRAGTLSKPDVKDLNRISSQLRETPPPSPDVKPPASPTAWW